MNKLELLYKMSKEMKSKEKVNGVVTVLGKNSEKEFVNGENHFEKDMVAKKLKINANVKVNTVDLVVDKHIEKELDLEKIKEKHKKMHEGHGCHCKGKNKFAKLEMLFKTLNDLELTEDAQGYALKLDIKEILKKKKERIIEKHGDMKNCSMDKCECEDFKEMLKVKHAIMKEIFEGEYKEVTLKLSINKEFEIKNVSVTALGNKEVKFNVALNY